MKTTDGEAFHNASTLTDAMLARKCLILCRQASRRTTPHFTAYERIALDRLKLEFKRRESILWPNLPVNEWEEPIEVTMEKIRFVSQFNASIVECYQCMFFIQLSR